MLSVSATATTVVAASVVSTTAVTSSVSSASASLSAKSSSFTSFFRGELVSITAFVSSFSALTRYSASLFFAHGCKASLSSTTSSIIAIIVIWHMFLVI
jgi:hypothetical protein